MAEQQQNDAPPITVEKAEGVLTLRLSRPKANVLDSAMVGAFRSAFAAHVKDPHLKAILIASTGPHFSFGASVEEHKPDQAAAMLKELNALIVELISSNVPCVAAVRGQCLGGALELVSCASFVFAAPDAKLGQPEIKLGVTAPVASVLLPLRLGQAHAERLLITGGTAGAEHAKAIGLVDEIAEDPEAAAREFIGKELADKSASSLRFAVRASRLRWLDGLEEALARQERLYLDELMATHDAKEGIFSFLEKRAPKWEDR